MTQERELADLLGLGELVLQHFASGKKTAVSASTFYEHAKNGLSSDSRLMRLFNNFDLSVFERVVVLVSAVLQNQHLELDVLKGSGYYPCFELLRNLFGVRAEFEIATNTRPLLKWKMLHFATDSDFEHVAAIDRRPFILDNRIMMYLRGVDYLPIQIAPYLQGLAFGGSLSEAHRDIVDAASREWQNLQEGNFPVIQLVGSEQRDKIELAKNICFAAGAEPFLLSGQGLRSEELQDFMLYWNREAKLLNRVMIVDASNTVGDVNNMIDAVIAQNNSAMIVLNHETKALGKNTLTYKVEKPNRVIQAAIWLDALTHRFGQSNNAETQNEAQRLANQFHFSTHNIEIALGEAQGQLSQEKKFAQHQSLSEAGEAIWDACRVQSRPGFESETATRIQAATRFQDIVLGEEQTKVLEEMMGHVRVRSQVHSKYGFMTANERGLGISCLFAGPSGTGKTTAAEALALELKLDLYRVDLSSMVSKYIGETEKNLRKIFDAAESGAAILLFDEADALFGKRGEVKESHDRYANMEVSYLLQRMETYSGLAILTTNLEQGMDTAFMRRLRFTVRFDLPDAARREKIWQKFLPDQDLDYKKLAMPELAGGNIRNIAMNAAFSAEVQGVAIQMQHLHRAAFAELTKLGRLAEKQKLAAWMVA